MGHREGGVEEAAGTSPCQELGKGLVCHEGGQAQGQVHGTVMYK